MTRVVAFLLAGFLGFPVADVVKIGRVGASDASRCVNCRRMCAQLEAYVIAQL